MKKPSSKWHAISIVLQKTSCAASTLCRNERFLSTKAPGLPLRDCDRAADCQCKFKHHEDRRGVVRRTDDVHRGIRSDFVERNRRSPRARRTMDGR